MKAILFASLVVLVAGCSSPGSADAGYAIQGLACGDAGTCGPNELCVEGIYEHGTWWRCQTNECGDHPDCACLAQAGTCPGGPAAGCAIDAGVVQCFAPGCGSAPRDFCLTASFSDGGEGEACVTNWNEVEGLGCETADPGFRAAQCDEFEALVPYGNYGGDNPVPSAYFDPDSGALVAAEWVNGHSLMCAPSIGLWPFPNCFTEAVLPQCASDAGVALPRLACGDAGTCAYDEFCVSSGSSWSCVPGESCEYDSTCNCFASADAGICALDAGCAVQSGIVACTRP